MGLVFSCHGSFWQGNMWTAWAWIILLDLHRFCTNYAGKKKHLVSTWLANRWLTCTYLGQISRSSQLLDCAKESRSIFGHFCLWQVQGKCQFTFLRTCLTAFCLLDQRYLSQGYVWLVLQYFSLALLIRRSTRGREKVRSIPPCFRPTWSVAQHERHALWVGKGGKWWHVRSTWGYWGGGMGINWKGRAGGG